TTGTDKFQIEVIGPNLTWGQAYSWVIATAAGGIQRNGTAFTGTFDPGDYALTSPNWETLSGVSLVADPTNLTLNFTPTPEPTGLLALAGSAALAAGSLLRRKSRRAPGAVA